MQGDLLRNKPSRKHNNTQTETQIQRNDYPMSIMFPQTWSLLTLVLCFACLKTIKRWSRWSSKAEVQQWDTYPEPTELRLIGYLTESTWTQRTNSNTLTPKTQLADILIKGDFTRDEWNHLLHLLNISNFSSARRPKTMAMQEEKGEEIIFGKVEADAEPGFASCSKLFNSARRYSKHPVKVWVLWPVEGDLQLKIQIRMTQRRVLKWCNQMQRRKTVRGDSLLREQTRTWIFKPVQGDLPRKIQTSSTTTYLVLTFHILRKSTLICDRNLVACQEKKWQTSMWILWYGECWCLSPWMPQFILGEAIWGFTFSTTDSKTNKLFDVTKKLIIDQKNQGISMIDWHQRSWQRKTLLTDRAVQSLTAKTNVFSDSALCMGKMNENPIRAWKENIEWFMNSSRCRELDRIDGEPTEFE